MPRHIDPDLMGSFLIVSTSAIAILRTLPLTRRNVFIAISCTIIFTGIGWIFVKGVRVMSNQWNTYTGAVGSVWRGLRGIWNLESTRDDEIKPPTDNQFTTYTDSNWDEARAKVTRIQDLHKRNITIEGACARENISKAQYYRLKKALEDRDA